MAQNDKEKKCWKCKRIIVGSSKLRLCPDCFNKVGSTVVTAGGLLATAAVSLFFKDHNPFKKE